MKKLLLSTAAVAGLALAAVSPAAAADGLKLGVSGFMAGYGLYTDQDDFGSSNNYRNFDLRKATEVAFNGETTLENGLTVGAFINAYGDRASAHGDFEVEQSYMYFSGAWGRVNLGETVGAGYLLQVAAPSGDDFVDGFDPEINTVALNALTSAGGVTDGTLSYGQLLEAYKNKITYFTPVFNGFQAAATVTPSIGEGDLGPTDALTVDNVGTAYDMGYELAGRYQGSFDAFDLTLGAGYGHASRENTSATLESRDQYNVGAVVNVGAFDIGAAYTHDDNGVKTDGDTRNWVFGADYKVGAYKVGVSYLNRKDEANSTRATNTNDLTTERYATGVTYEYGPGMSFRGSIAYFQADEDTAGVQDGDAIQVGVGTVVNF